MLRFCALADYFLQTGVHHQVHLFPHHQVHLFPHHLHLCYNVGWSYVCGGWMTHIWSFWPARGIATFRPFLVSSVCAGAFLVLLLSVMSCVSLTQLLFHILILFGETFHCSREGLDLPLQGSGSRFISLNVVGGHHQASKYHATLCLGNDSMANSLCSHRRRQLMMPKKLPVSHIVLACLRQYLHNKKRRPNREHWCGVGQIPSEGQVRISHNSRVSELG